MAIEPVWLLTRLDNQLVFSEYELKRALPRRQGTRPRNGMLADLETISRAV
jgi:hypothetical protein